MINVNCLDVQIERKLKGRECLIIVVDSTPSKMHPTEKVLKISPMKKKTTYYQEYIDWDKSVELPYKAWRTFQ